MHKWLKKLKSSLSISPADKQSAQTSIELAISVLLVEIMHADHVFDEREERLVISLLQEQCDLNQDEARKIYQQAGRILDDAVSLHQYTSLLHAELSNEEKFNLLVSLWKIALADGELDRYEEHLIRKIHELLYISHSDFIKAKHQAMGTA